uniref:Uncharacterized protein n=1 Tax=Physcomitrium patens TaxID=3218 RepID=A0A2K1ID19_PHYPA|nr:hypothetical protein PHYPA_030660 [Physcomitrium patens]
MAVEGSRLKLELFLSVIRIYSIISQITGMSMSFCLVWLPMYFPYDAGTRDHNQS